MHTTSLNKLAHMHEPCSMKDQNKIISDKTSAAPPGFRCEELLMQDWPSAMGFSQHCETHGNLSYHYSHAYLVTATCTTVNYTWAANICVVQQSLGSCQCRGKGEHYSNLSLHMHVSLQWERERAEGCTLKRGLLSALVLRIW